MIDHQTAKPASAGDRPVRSVVLEKVIHASAWVGARAPVALAHGLASVGGNVEWALRPGKRRRLAENLAHAVSSAPDDPEVRVLARHEIVNEAHRSADLLWALGRPDQFMSSVEILGLDHARGVLASGSGLILLGAHIGGWEVATRVPGATLSRDVCVIVADDWIARGIHKARERAGLKVVYARHAARPALEVLRRGNVLLMLGDDSRYAARRRPVRFLDARAELAGGFAWLSRKAQAPVVGFSVLPLAPRRWRVTIDPPLCPPAPDDIDGELVVLQQVADRWSEIISAHPDHWAASFPIPWRDTP